MISAGTGAAAAALGLAAEAGSFCAGVADAFAAARAVERSASTVAVVTPDGAGARATCRFSTDISGAKSTNCSWAYPYRSEAAAREFAAMLDAVAGCAVRADDDAADAPVNHPDSYELHLFRAAGGEIGLSLKDKAALDATYIFLRTTPAN